MMWRQIIGALALGAALCACTTDPQPAPPTVPPTSPPQVEQAEITIPGQVIRITGTGSHHEWDVDYHHPRYHCTLTLYGVWPDFNGVNFSNDLMPIQRFQNARIGTNHFAFDTHVGNGGSIGIAAGDQQKWQLACIGMERG